MSYTLNQPSDTHIELVISGKISEEHMTSLLDEWMQAMSSIKKYGENSDKEDAPATLLHRIENLALPTFSAVLEEMRRLPELWATMKYFSKMAVISDQQWIQTVAEIEGWMIPNLDIKGFNPEDEAAAKKWLNIE